MKSGILPVALISGAGIALLTACGANQSIVTGDFSSIDYDLEDSTVEISYRIYSDEFDERVVLASERIERGEFELKFSYEEEIPRFAWIRISSPEGQFLSGKRMLLERGAQYTMLTAPDSKDAWFTLSSTGPYAHIIATDLDYEFHIHEARRALVELEQQVTNGTGDVNQHDEEFIDLTPRKPSMHATVRDWENLTCSDYAGKFEPLWEKQLRTQEAQDRVRLSKELFNVRRKYRELMDSSYDERTQTLTEIIRTSSDPVERLLVLEYGVDISISENVRLLKELETQLPADVVADRIAPRLPWLLDAESRERADKALKLGTYAPTFELTTEEDQNVSMTTLLQSNKLVVLEFWENYCARCIEAFEKYRDFYSEFAELGVEIVSISLESEREDWIEKSDELQLPWTNGFVPGGHDGEVALMYGVDWPRKNYVLDSEGCILKRDLTPRELRDFLGARLGS